jgi:hypothetical protein
MRAVPAVATRAVAATPTVAAAAPAVPTVERERREPPALGNQAVQRILRGSPPREDPPPRGGAGDGRIGTMPLHTARAGLMGAARPLPTYPRTFLESRFRTDFSRVRIHTDDWAARAAAQLDAAAYTLGERVAFGRGRYAPHTEHGLRLLGHELAHVVQQRGASIPEAPSPRAVPTQALETDADRTIDAMARGEFATVQTRAPIVVPLLHPVYISRHGRQGFLDEALAFYRGWGVAPVTPNVDSIEQIVGDLAGKGPIGHITIVSHAHPTQVFLALISGGTSGISLEDWDIDTLEELPELELHVLPETSVQDLVTLLSSDPTHSRRLARIGSPDDPIVRQFLWWALEFEFVSRAGFKPKKKRAQLQKITQLNADRYRDTILLATAAVAGFGGGGPGERDFTQLRESIRAVVAARFVFERPTKAEQKGFAKTIKRSPNAAVNRVLRDPVFITNLERMRANISADSWIEVQGCRAGQNRDYLVAMRQFFTGPNGAPRVSAPDWYQYFGHYGYTSVPNTPRALRAQWRRRRVREALDYWMPIITGNAVPLGADWETLRDYLAAGNVLPLSFPGSPGVVSVLVPEAMQRDAFLRWLSRHSYRLTDVDDIRDQFVRFGRFGQLVAGVRVDWLQERSDREHVPTEMAFRPDPEYQQHIISVP